jgi:hypothetical protein
VLAKCFSDLVRANRIHGMPPLQNSKADQALTQFWIEQIKLFLLEQINIDEFDFSGGI